MTGINLAFLHTLIGEWKKLHNEKLSDLYSLHKYCAAGKIEKNEIGGR
jgi:hypothetical protein